MNQADRKVEYRQPVTTDKCRYARKSASTPKVSTGPLRALISSRKRLKQERRHMWSVVRTRNANPLIPLSARQDFGLVAPCRTPLFFCGARQSGNKHGRVRRHILMRLIAQASFFICSILLCGVGLYFFANKPWFYENCCHTLDC